MSSAHSLTVLLKCLPRPACPSLVAAPQQEVGARVSQASSGEYSKMVSVQEGNCRKNYTSLTGPGCLLRGVRLILAQGVRPLQCGEGSLQPRIMRAWRRQFSDRSLLAPENRIKLRSAEGFVKTPSPAEAEHTRKPQHVITGATGPMRSAEAFLLTLAHSSGQKENVHTASMGACLCMTMAFIEVRAQVWGQAWLHYVTSFGSAPTVSV